MRYINKTGGGGQAWDQFAATTGARFDNAPSTAKNDLRLTLARQQGYLCAFCMARLTLEEDAAGNITKHKTKIAHLTSQAAPAGATEVERERRRRLAVDQRNLVLACEGKNKPYRHCDDIQEQRDVTINFENAGFMTANFQYHKNGLLVTPSATVREQIGAEREADDVASVLNLNNPVLCRLRREAVESVAYALSMRGDYDTETLTAKLEKYKQPHPETGCLEAYCECFVHFLTKKIERNKQQFARPASAPASRKDKNMRRRYHTTQYDPHSLGSRVGSLGSHIGSVGSHASSLGSHASRGGSRASGGAGAGRWRGQGGKRKGRGIR